MNGKTKLRELSKIYNKEYFEGLEELYPFRIQMTVSLLGQIKGKRILDLGCGTGEGSEVLRCCGATVVSVDIAQFALSACHASKFEVVGGATHALPFQNECFDGVLFMDIIEHIPRNLVILTLQEIQRVIKNSGKIAIHTMPNVFLEKLSILYGLVNRKHWRRTGISGGHVNTYSCWRLKNDLETSGLIITFFNITPYPREAPFSFLVSPISLHLKWLLGNDIWVCCVKKKNNMRSEKTKKKEKKFFETHFKEDGFDQKTYDFVHSIAGKTESTILELGCGSGGWTKDLEKNGNFVIGVDFSFYSIRELKKTIGDSNIEVVVADLEYLPFKSNFADQVFFGWVLHHTTDVNQSLKEAKHCLRNDGNMVMIEPNGSNFLRVFTHKVGVLLNKVLKNRLTSYEEKPLNIYKVLNILVEIGLTFQVFPWEASKRTIIKNFQTQRYSFFFNCLIQANILFLRIYQSILPGIFGSSDFVIVSLVRDKSDLND
jgi:ubiquinone/menaquinone biosynthesis C-methylase UbiE